MSKKLRRAYIYNVSFGAPSPHIIILSHNMITCPSWFSHVTYHKSEAFGFHSKCPLFLEIALYTSPARVPRIGRKVGQLRRSAVVRANFMSVLLETAPSFSDSDCSVALPPQHCLKCYLAIHPHGNGHFAIAISS